MSNDISLPQLPARSVILWFTLGIAAILSAVYGLSLWNGFVTFDDDILVFNNVIAQSFTPYTIAYVFTHFDPELYIPLTFITYQLNWIAGGGSPFLFHLTNLILHFGNVLLVAWFLYLLSGKKWIAAACAVLFAVHPLNTEAVAWISARKDLLSTFFFLLSSITYLYATVLPPPSGEGRGGGERLYWLSISLFILGLLSKVSIILLPFILLLIDIYKGRKCNVCVFMDKIPYLIVSLIFGVIALFGKQSSISDAPLMTYILMAPKSIVHYLQSFFLPTHLSVIYPFAHTVSIASADLSIPLIVFLLILIVAIVAAFKSKTILFGSLFFAIMLAPSFTNISKNGDLYIASDRYAYAPMIGLLFMIAVCVERFCAHSDREKVIHHRFHTATTVVVILAIIFAATAYRRSTVWASTETLFADAVLKEPSSSLAHNKLGSQLLDDGQVGDAEKEFRASLALKDNARAHYNLGLVYLQRNETTDALNENQQAIALEPDYAPAHVNLGYLLWQSGNIDEAISHFLIAIKNEQHNIDARLNLAIIYMDRGRKEDARALIEEILNIDPQNQDAMQLKLQMQ